jgi:peptidoglycan/LPS O-acetylase OafA/YrhL
MVNHPAGVGKYSASLDLARFVISILVVIAHSASPALIGNNPSIALNSGIASTIFFSLSGYIICSTSGFWRNSSLHFAARRFARLLPLHWLSCFLLLPWVLIGADRWPLSQLLPEAFWWLLGLQAFHWEQSFDLYMNLNGPAWSITPLLYGTLLLPLVKTRTLAVWSASRLVAVMALLYSLRLAATFLPPSPVSNDDLFLRHVQPVPHMLEILIGGLASLVLAKPCMARFKRWVSRDAVVIGVAALIVALLAVTVSTHGRLGVFYLVHGPVFPLALLFVVALHANNGFIESASAKPWVKTAGELSILIFLLHVPVLALVSRIAIAAGLQLDSLLLAAVIAGSCLLSLAILPHFRALQQFLFPAPQPAPAYAGPATGSLVALAGALAANSPAPQSRQSAPADAPALH